MRTWNAGPIYASALNVGSGGATFRDSLNILIGARVGDSLTSGWGNLFTGNNVAQRNTTGHANIGYGTLSMGGSSTANITGNHNVSIGYAAGRLITSGIQNVFVGGSDLSATGVNNFSAGAGCSSCANNVSIGNGTGNFTTGSGNVAIGRAALRTSNARSNNTAVGSEAMFSVNGTSGNTAIGYRAGYNLTGSGTFIGAQSGFYATSGLSNMVIGADAFSTALSSILLTGSNNVAIGDQSLNIGSNIGAGNENFNRTVGIGFQAGNGTLDGANDNVSIGYRAGNGTFGINADTMKGKNNIAIGSASRLPALTSDNQITFWTAATGGTGGYNALTRFTGGGWLVNATTSTVTTATASAALEINGVTRGFLPPRLTTGERNAIASPAAGLSVYNSSLATNDVYTTAWYQQPNGLTGSGTLDFPSTGAHSSSDLTITVTGAADGDMVILGVPNASVTNDSNYTAWVSIANTVTVRYNHYGSGTNNPASGLFKVYVIKN
jgi:hypothetical protein